MRPLIDCSLARVVRVDDAEQTQTAGSPQAGRVHGRGGLVLTACPLEARGARTRHLPQPRDEGARAGVKTVA